MLDASDPDRPETWRFQNYTSWHGPPYAEDLKDPDERRKFYKERVSQFCEPLRTAVDGVQDDDILPVDAGQQWSPIPWDNHNGRVTLAGDVAHSMVPRKFFITAFDDCRMLTFLQIEDRISTTPCRMRRRSAMP